MVRILKSLSLSFSIPARIICCSNFLCGSHSFCKHCLYSCLHSISLHLLFLQSLLVWWNKNNKPQWTTKNPSRQNPLFATLSSLFFPLLLPSSSSSAMMISRQEFRLQTYKNLSFCSRCFDEEKSSLGLSCTGTWDPSFLPYFLVAVMMMGPTPQSMPWDERWRNFQHNTATLLEKSNIVASCSPSLSTVVDLSCWCCCCDAAVVVWSLCVLIWRFGDGWEAAS